MARDGADDVIGDAAKIRAVIGICTRIEASHSCIKGGE